MRSPVATAEITVDAIAAGGDGVARADGLVIFLPRTAPGDVGTARFVSHGRFARGALVALQTPSPDRVDPPCTHYTRDDCGGCQLQHLRYAVQLEAKRQIIRDALERIARRSVPPIEVHPAPRQWRYRRKLTLALRRRRGRWIAGLHPYGRPRAVFSVQECPITEDAVMAAWAEVLQAGATLPEVPELRGAVRVDAAETSFVLEGARSWPHSERFFERVPSLGALWWTPERGTRRLLHARGRTREPSASFAQVNAEVGALLHAHVVRRAMAYEPATAVDAYAGRGDLAVALAQRGVSVAAIEADADAAGWSATLLPPGSRALAGRVEDVLPASLPADVIVLNPPRTGVDERVTDALTHAPAMPRAVLYVSCNPATLARDLLRLPRYRIASLVAFDMFPQTAHVETVCELVPEARS
ncbi:MAG TPA: hypothetical protein VFW98_15455 [Gemmatimonadaceae bacterium]|nr:hypothetical protein [Gemmatimonadaceae bacterium]